MPAALSSPKLNTLSPDTWPGRANIHTYYTRIHVKTTVGAKGEDENRGKKNRERVRVWRSQRTKPYVWNNLESSFKP